MPSTAPIVTRLAPSPTGAQHLGNARSYLITWLLARQAGGRIVLRIEDIDSPRVKPGAAEQALEDLRWLGLDWDVGPIVQTERIVLYQAALDRLKAMELVYPCTCTRSDVEQAASAPHADGAEVVYPGTCSGRSAGDAAELVGRSFAWRFRVCEVPAYDDLFRGQVALNREEIGGDFVVWKSQGGPAYQLAVVVDDADNGVNVVVRGDDLVSSTPRQLLLFQAFGLTPPRFAHVPLVVGPDGRRLAKRHGDTRLTALRSAGVRSEQVIGLMAWSCGWQPEPTPVTVNELIPRFQLAAIPRHPFVITPQLLIAACGYAG
ncbi:MAG TPA: tRNA glutamyl-Q(34) synthetase GluQRS [Gemmataceae bacterium]|nr:tRNA glutamyl-Q(34) synthetase GluQRS [Gemmataceae bacterium]